MNTSIITKLMSNYNYFIVIKCKINKEYSNTNHIPSFTTNKTVGYLVKNIHDIYDIVREIFLVWRFKYHSNSDKSIKKANLEHMEQIIKNISNLNSFPYLDFRIDSGIVPFSDIDCWFRVYNMQEEFIHLLDLVYKEDRPEFNKCMDVVHRVIPYVVYKDHNPNRLQVHITNSNSITKNINQTFLVTRDIYNLDYYTHHFNKLELKIKNQKRFIKLLNSGTSFLLTKDDFESNRQILYSNVYFLSPVDERVTSVKDDVYYLKMNHIIQMIDDIFKPRLIDGRIGSIIMSFL